jgi:hypothetical protein
MDLTLAPKLTAAALLGAAVATSLPHPSKVDKGVLLRLEWIGTGKGPKDSQSIVLRTLLSKPTTLTQGYRTIVAEPARAEDGSYLVKLKVTSLPHKGEGETLDTMVRSESGETNVVMGDVRKDGRTVHERLFFLTTTPLE